MRNVLDPKTAGEEGAVISIGEGTPETVRELINRPHRMGSYAAATVLLPTAQGARILLEVEERTHVTVADWIRTAVWRLLANFDQLNEGQQQVDVPVPDDV